MSDLTPFRDMAQVINDLPVLVRNARRARGLSLREAGREVGVDFQVITRIEQGKDFNTRALPAILEWLDRGYS